MRGAQVLLLFGAMLQAAGGPACQVSTQTLPAESPLKRIELIDESLALLELESGISARDIVGAGRFAGLEPGWTPAMAEAREGKPLEVVEKREDERVLFVYERQGMRAAVVQQKFMPSGGGRQEGTSFYIVAFPPADFTEILPKPISTFIRSQHSLRRINLVSGVPGDWRISLDLADGKVETIRAHPAAPPDPHSDGG